MAVETCAIPPFLTQQSEFYYTPIMGLTGLCTSGALSARGISNCNREDLGKRWADIEGPIDKSLGTKEALAVRF